jgi:glycosyltransferase involved in cell wall biosynthesis
VYEDLDFQSNPKKTPIVAPSEIEMIRNADMVVSVGHRMSLLRRSQGAKRPLFIPHGVDLEKFEKAITMRHRYRARKDITRNLVFSGSVNLKWGLELALRAIKELKNSFKLKFFIVGLGEPKSMHTINSLIARLNLSDVVKILDPVPYHDLWKIMSFGEIGLAPYPPGSPAEFAVPLKIKEYCAAGIPIVTINVKETGSFVNNNRIGLATEYEPRSYAKAISLLLTNGHLYRSMASNALETAKKYRWNMLFEREWHEIKKIIQRI